MNDIRERDLTELNEDANDKEYTVTAEIKVSAISELHALEQVESVIGVSIYSYELVKVEKVL